ncbi:MAG: MarR family transcriptional regulator [Nannocystaceae bacterium]|nr:MarR family transcriptional regulator [Myxococcales bacterium]
MSGNVKSGGPAIEAFTRMMFTHIITGLARLLRNEGLSIGHIAALHLLDQHGTRSVSEIAAALELSVSAASRLTDGLVRRGLVSRTEDAADRRVKTLALTGEGVAFVDQISADRVRVIMAIADELPKKLVQGVLSGIRHYVRR